MSGKGGLRMKEQKTTQGKWYDAVQRYTERLVAIKSVSPSEDEVRVAEAVVDFLKETQMEKAYTAIGLDAVEVDPYHRQNAYAFLKGQHPQTVVLLGHIDTVGTADYGPFEQLALQPTLLAEVQDQLAEITPGLREDLENPASQNDWMLGRGVVDMKSGVAVNIAIMRHCAQLARQGRLPLSMVLLATVDEENESAGVLQAVQFLLKLREQYGLQYVGVINTDYTGARTPGDPHRYAYTGTIGKLLPTFLVVGAESHVGEPFEGLDANLLAAQIIADLSMNETLCDEIRGQKTPPPVTLHATDLKSNYDVQLPFMAYFYLNVLTLSTTPDELLARLREHTEAALQRVLARIEAAEQRWNTSAGVHHRAYQVFTFAELYERVSQSRGHQQVEETLDDEWEHSLIYFDSRVRDARERSVLLVQRLWRLSGLSGPAVVLFYSPPYYPHVGATSCPLQDAVEAVARAHPDLLLKVEEYYPFLSDMSYLRGNPGVDLSALTQNMPLWSDEDNAQRPGAYSLPLREIQLLDAPFVNLGPYGRAPHQRGERLLMSYSFEILPQLITEVIKYLAQHTTNS